MPRKKKVEEEVVKDVPDSAMIDAEFVPPAPPEPEVKQLNVAEGSELIVDEDFNWESISSYRYRNRGCYFKDGKKFFCVLVLEQDN